VVAYHYGKNSALALWGSGPAFGMDPNMVLAWHYYGGGKALLDEIYKSLNMDVVSYLYGPMPTQPLGWFKKPVPRSEMKGLKFRTVGLAVDVFTELGAAVNPLPGGEIVPALDRGLIDAAEFNNASVRPPAGLPRRGQELHAAELPPERRAVRDPVQQGQVRRPAGRAQGHHRLRRAGRQRRHELEGHRPQLEGLHRAQEGQGQLLQDARRHPAAQLAAWDKVIAKKAGENPLFKKVLDSQKAFAAARRPVAERLHGRLQDGLQPLLPRQEGLSPAP
jgi:hypothetical protein